MNKDEVRGQMRRMRRALSEEAQREAEEAVFARVSALGAYRRARTVMAYAAARGELPLGRVLADALAAGKTLVLPRCAGEGVMHGHRVDAPDRLVKGAYGILEPGADCPRVEPEEIDLIILATSSPDYCFPNGACEVQAKVGAVNAACFDISSACTGFVFALSTAHAYISSGLYKTALVIGADLLSKLVDWTDRSTCVLFGDGAGAAVVTAAENGIIGLNMHSNGAKGGVLTCGSRSTGNFLLGKKPELGYMTMEGQEVFKFAVKQVPECIKEVLEETGNTAEDIDQFIIHQANYRIIESIAKRLKVDLEKFPVNMEHYGNTSGASVPILLDELNRAGKLKNGDKLVLAGFGAGLTWGAVLLEW